MRRRLQPLLALAALLALAPPALAGAPSPLVATRLTVANAANLLFAGTDADGGIDDWYLSNGIVELIVDDVGPQTDLPLGVTPPPKQSEAGFTGGSLIDFGLVGADNDQLVQVFTVGGLSTSNFVLYDSIEAFPDPPIAKIVVTGRVLGFNVAPEDLEVVTEYSVAPGEPYALVTTTVTNQSAEAAGARRPRRAGRGRSGRDAREQPVRDLEPRAQRVREHAG